MENKLNQSTSINKINNRPLFYCIWLLLVTIINILPPLYFYVGHHLSVFSSLSWLIIIGLLICLPIFLFNNLWLKLIPFLIIYPPVNYYFSISSITNNEDYGLAVILVPLIVISYLFILDLLIIEHFKAIRVSLYTIGGTVFLVATVVIVFGLINREFNKKSVLYNKVYGGDYSNIDDAINICESIRDTQYRGWCYFKLAERENRVDFCSKAWNSFMRKPVDTDEIQRCIKNVESQNNSTE